MTQTRTEQDAAEQDAAELEEDGFDREAIERRQAALEHVRKYGDPVLRATASPVTEFGVELERDLEQMGALMDDAIGVGLSAPQLGELRQLFVYRIPADEDGEENPLVTVVNPQIEWSSEETEVGEEGCLSLPLVRLSIERAARIRLRWQDPQGNEHVSKLDGLEARVAQHEIDHLNGVLIIDHVEGEERKTAIRALREALDG